MTLDKFLWEVSQSAKMVICEGYMDYLIFRPSGEYVVYNTSFFISDVQSVSIRQDDSIEIYIKK